MGKENPITEPQVTVDEPSKETSKEAEQQQPWKKYIQHEDLPPHQDASQAVRIQAEKDEPESLGG